MSEMKPWGYISPSATKTLLDRAQCDLTITRKSTHNITLPLYTAEQLAEAVAAEREQWSATVANALNWLKHGRIANARDDLKAAQRRAVNEAIRSAAK